MNIQHITPEMLKKQPDQTVRIINQIIDYINEHND